MPFAASVNVVNRRARPGASRPAPVSIQTRQFCPSFPSAHSSSPRKSDLLLDYWRRGGNALGSMPFFITQSCGEMGSGGWQPRAGRRPFIHPSFQANKRGSATARTGGRAFLLLQIRMDTLLAQGIGNKANLRTKGLTEPSFPTSCDRENRGPIPLDFNVNQSLKQHLKT